MTGTTPQPLTAERFVADLHRHRSDEERRKLQRYFKHADGDVFLGVRMGTVFGLAKEYVDLPPAGIEQLLDDPVHEVRAGAVRIMALQYASRRTSPQRRTELYELYLRRHDRIDNWDLIDLGAYKVVGPHLVDEPRDVLYRLARSGWWCERRTAIVATIALVGSGQVADTYRIAELLLADDHDLVHKGTGWALRVAGDRDRAGLRAFLDAHAAAMPAILLSYATEHLDAAERAHYRVLRRAGRRA